MKKRNLDKLVNSLIVDIRELVVDTMSNAPYFEDVFADNTRAEEAYNYVIAQIRKKL